MLIETNNEIKKDDIIVILSPIGEILGQYKGTTDTEIILYCPHKFVTSQDPTTRQIEQGFVPYSMIAPEKNIVFFNKRQIISKFKAPEEVAQHFRSQITGLILPKTGLIGLN